LLTSNTHFGAYSQKIKEKDGRFMVCSLIFVSEFQCFLTSCFTGRFLKVAFLQNDETEAITTKRLGRGSTK
jgi:hypothetical protein